MITNMENSNNSRNQQTRDEFFIFLEDEGVYISDLEKEVVQEFFSDDLHFSIGELKKRLETRGIVPTTRDVVGAMEKLLSYGFAKKSEFQEFGEPLYEHMHLTEHHDHMICIKCDNIIEFCVPTLEKLQTDVADLHHFRSLNHKLEIYGICGDCQGRRDPVIPLSMASAGEVVYLKKMKVSGEETRKMHDLGLLPGEKLEIINNSGQLIISVRGSRIALDGRTASKIFVSFENRGL